MIEAYEADDVRAAEAVLLARAPEGALMDRAAAGLAAAVAAVLRRRCGRVYGTRAGLLVGSGDNGGDTLLAGALLAARGVGVEAVLLGRRTHPRGLAALQRAGGRVHSLGPGTPPPDAADAAAAVLLGADVLLDGVLGIGATAGLRDPAAAVVTRLLASPTRPPVVAVDLPSGTGPDDGAAPHPVLPAELTVTFGCAKPTLLLPPAAGLAGAVQRVDLSIAGTPLAAHLPPVPAVSRLEPGDVARRWPVPDFAAHKYTRGVVGVVAGGQQYTGAAVLAVEAAVRSGAPMVRYLGPPHPTELVRQRRPEVVPGEGRVQAWVLGPGVDPQDAEQAGRVRDALVSGEPCVVDAGALDVAAEVLDGPAGATRSRPWLLTPHAGELAALLTRCDEPTERAAVEAAPAHHAARAAEVTGAVVLLKGPVTLVVPPVDGNGSPGTVWSQADAPAWLASAGAGDVLAGVAGTLLAAAAAAAEQAQELSHGDVALAGAMAACVHGLAARRASAGGPLPALAVAEALGGCIAGLLAEVAVGPAV